MEVKTARSSVIHNCRVRSRPRHFQAYCCSICKRMLDRVDVRGGKPNRAAREQALKNAWDGNCFRCYFTGWELSVDNPKSHLYLTWEHLTSGNEDDIVVAAAIINDMKSDLPEAEFRKLVSALARRFREPNYLVPMMIPQHYRR
jgi:hypothetical protein